MGLFDGLLGGVASGVIGLLGADKQNKQNRQMANAQMAFQEQQAGVSADFSREMAGRQEDFQRASQGTQMDYGREMVGRQEDFQRASNQTQMDYGREMVGRQEDFQRWGISNAQDYNTRMSNTSYQRGMADMRAAGLNPILAFGQGGATAPTISSASGASASASSMPGASASVGSMSGATGSRPSPSGSIARMENVLGPLVSSAAQGARTVQELQNMVAQEANTNAQTNLLGEQQHQVRADTAMKYATEMTEQERRHYMRYLAQTERQRSGLVVAQTAQTGASADNIRAQTETELQRPAYVAAQRDQATESAGVSRATEHNLRTYGPPGVVSSTIGGVSQGLNSIIEAIRRELQ
ncbi:MAG: DNA pilot protein [Microvirus sp.]|nr:MAG: DNA pilot protein [Microvirus sp.]